MENRYSKDNPSYKRIVVPNNMILHLKPRDVIGKKNIHILHLEKAILLFFALY